MTKTEKRYKLLENIQKRAQNYRFDVDQTSDGGLKDDILFLLDELTNSLKAAADLMKQVKKWKDECHAGLEELKHLKIELHQYQKLSKEQDDFLKKHQETLEKRMVLH